MRKDNSIELLRTDVDIPDVVQKRADQAFDKILKNKVPISEDMEDAFQNNKQIKGFSRFPKKRIAIIIAAAILALSTITVAAAYLHWSRSFSEGMRVTEKQKVQMKESKMTEFLSQSCTDQGVTITAIQSITDNYYTQIAFKVEGYQPEEGIQPWIEEFNVTIGGEGGEQAPFIAMGKFYDGLMPSPDGGKVTYADGSPVDIDENGRLVSRYAAEDGSLEYHLFIKNGHERGYFINKPIHVELKNLGSISKAEFENQIAGTWSFDWELTGSEDAKEYTLDVPLGDSGATVIKAELSPISFRAWYEFPRQTIIQHGKDDNGEMLLDENGNEVIFEIPVEPPELTGVKMKDGAWLPFISTSAPSTGYESEDSDICYYTAPTDRVIDVEQIDSLLFRKVNWVFEFTEDYEPLNEDPVSEDNFYIVPIK